MGLGPHAREEGGVGAPPGAPKAQTAPRAIARITDAGAEVDRELLGVAEAGTVADLDRAVRHWQSLADQDRGVDDYLRGFERRACGRPAPTTG